MKVTHINTLFLSLLLTSCISSRDGSAIRSHINELKQQNPVPELGKAEMYADFDTLVSLIERCNPQYLVRKKVTGYDMIAEMRERRQHIENCHNTMEYIRLLKEVLSLSLDAHCNAAGSTVWHYQHSFYKGEVELNGITNEDFGINFHYIHDIFRKNPPVLNLLYIGGSYFLKYSTTLIRDTDSVTIPAGTEVLSFNRQSIGDCQNIPINWHSCWDQNRRSYYNPRLSVAHPQNSIGFATDNGDKEYSFTEFLQMKRNPEYKGYMVRWIERDSVIYIALPVMNYVKEWLKELKSELLKFKKQPVRAVIIDIRGNWGGDDHVWVETMEMISKMPIEYPYYYLTTTDTEVIKRTIPQEKHLIPKEESRRILEYVDPHYPFRVRTEVTDTLKTQKKNLGYEGIIYLLTDEEIYSSAGAFKSLDTKTDRIKSIGMPTGKVLGRGLTPSVFILPYSRLIFTMELVLDAAGVSKAEDFYHDHIHYPVQPGIEYYKYWYDPARTYKIDENAMYRHDEVFLKALEIIKNSR